MVMVIKSNVPSNIIANPDGWNPPFSMNGLVYAGIYGRGSVSKNYAPGGIDAVVFGAPVVSDHFALLSEFDYLDTNIPTSKAATLIAVVKKTASADRQFIISSYAGSNYGKSLLIDPPNARLTGYSHYKGNNSAGAPVNTAIGSWYPMSDADGRPALVFHRDTGQQLSLGDMTGNKVVNTQTPGDATAYVDPTLKFKIGHSNSNYKSSPTSIAAAMIYDRALSDAELEGVYQYFKAYFSRRGISI